jgi:hypothetical protein
MHIIPPSWVRIKHAVLLENSLAFESVNVTHLLEASYVQRERALYRMPTENQAPSIL